MPKEDSNLRKHRQLLRVGIVVFLILLMPCDPRYLYAHSSSSLHPVDSISYHSEEVSYKSRADGAHFAGTLTQPEGRGPFPAVLLLSGAGFQDRDQTVYGHRTFKVLAEYLTSRGISVLRVDDRGVGATIGSISNATPETLTIDAISGVQYLTSRVDMCGSPIGLIGHSEGAHIATVAANLSGDVDFIVMLGGIGLTWPQNNQLAQAEMLKRLGKSEGVVTAALELNQRIYSVVVEGHDQITTEKLLASEIQDWRTSLAGDAKQEFDNFTRENPGHWTWLADQFAEPAYQYYMKTDPRKFIRRLECPVLALIGEKDIQVLPEPNLNAIESALKEINHPDYEVQKLRGLNHLFQTSKTGLIGEYASIEETFSQEALELVSIWIIERFGDTRGNGSLCVDSRKQK